MNDAPFRAILEDAWKTNTDPAHDFGHVQRVVANAKTIAQVEGANLNIIIPAAWLHDIVNVPKNHPDRAKASVIAADKAIQELKNIAYASEYLNDIHHSIVAHSFSANITPQTLEARVLQDADRLDALGAIGIARCFAVSGILGRPLFDPADPLAEDRMPDDTIYGLDHFKVKLYKIADTLHTQSARDMAAARVAFMKDFEMQLSREAR